MIQMYYDFLKQKKGKISKWAKRKWDCMLLQRKKGCPTPCYTRMITDEQSVVYIKYNTYPQDFYTTSFYIGVIVMRWKMRPFQTGLQPHEKRHKTIIIR